MTMSLPRRRPQGTCATFFFILLLPIVSSYFPCPLLSQSFRFSSSLYSTSTESNSASAAEEDTVYFSIPDPQTVPRSTSQRITLTRYLDNVVKERPEVSFVVNNSVH